MTRSEFKNLVPLLSSGEVYRGNDLIFSHAPNSPLFENLELLKFNCNSYSIDGMSYLSSAYPVSHNCSDYVSYSVQNLFDDFLLYSNRSPIPNGSYSDYTAYNDANASLLNSHSLIIKKYDLNGNSYIVSNLSIKNVFYARKGDDYHPIALILYYYCCGKYHFFAVNIDNDFWGGVDGDDNNPMAIESVITSSTQHSFDYSHSTANYLTFTFDNVEYFPKDYSCFVVYDTYGNESLRTFSNSDFNTAYNDLVRFIFPKYVPPKISKTVIYSLLKDFVSWVHNSSSNCREYLNFS